MAGLSKSGRREQAGTIDHAVTLPALPAKIEPAGVTRAARKSYLAGLHNVTRRPPAMRLQSSATIDFTGIEAQILPEVKRIAATETSDFAFSIAELALRLEKRVNAGTDQGAKDGLAVLSEMARMYEHLFVLQSGETGA